jgi:hypothetical protein
VVKVFFKLKHGGGVARDILEGGGHCAHLI